jgi:hypothetical protein
MDLDREKVVSAPRAMFSKGGDAAMRSGERSGVEVILSLSVNSTGTQVKYTCVVSREGKVLSSQTATFSLTS